MFSITFEDEICKQWICEYIFNDFEDAKKYLINQGFIEKNRLFERKDYNWSSFIRAYINPVRIYSMKS